MTSFAAGRGARPDTTGMIASAGQAGGAGDRVVHARRDADVVGVDRAHDGGGERRDERDEAEPKRIAPGSTSHSHDGVGADASRQQPGGGEERPTVS